MSPEMTVMSKLEALGSSWDLSVLHADAELDVICPLVDNHNVLWCASCGDRSVWVWVKLELSVLSWGLGSTGCVCLLLFFCF